MKACEPALMRLDAEVARLFKGDMRLAQSGDAAAPRLQLTAADGSVLTFAGDPTPETRYGGPGTTVFLEVAAQRVQCKHPLIPDHRCLQVRERRDSESGVALPPQEVFDRLVDGAAEGYDLDVRVGDDIAPHLIARKLADNHRLLCVAPAYLARRGTPRSLAKLAAHDCLVIKERDHPLGVWRLHRGQREHTVKMRGPLSANNGEMAVQWAVDGRGIILRSTWDVQPLIDAGKLVPILPQYRQTARPPDRQTANVWAVYPARLNASAKVHACVEFLAGHIVAGLTDSARGGPGA